MADRAGAPLAQQVKELILRNDLDYVGIAPVERFEHAPEGHRPGDLLPGAKSVISMGTRINKGPQLVQQRALRDRSYRHAAFSYRWLGYGLINMYVNDRAALLVTRLLEEEGYASLPIVGSGVEDARHMMAAFSNRHAAVAAGLGEIGWNGLCLTPENGPRQRFVSVITTALLDPDPMYQGPRLCDPERCSEAGGGRPVCVGVCPLNLFSKHERVEAVFGDRRFTYAAMDHVKCGGTIGLGIHPLVLGADSPKIPRDVDMDVMADLVAKAPPWLKLVSVAFGRGHWCGLCLLRCPVGMPEDVEAILNTLYPRREEIGVTA
jgi:epoxyqueuosine reductase